MGYHFCEVFANVNVPEIELLILLSSVAVAFLSFAILRFQFRFPSQSQEIFTVVKNFEPFIFIFIL